MKKKNILKDLGKFDEINTCRKSVNVVYPIQVTFKTEPGKIMHLKLIKIIYETNNP